MRLRTTWGAGAGQLGHRADPEGAPEGPMSLAAGPGGELLVLDQVNGRVQRFDADGRVTGDLSLSGDTAQDLALGAGGEVFVLDRIGQGVVEAFAPDGKPLPPQDVVGGPVREGGELTGIFADARGLYLEREHGELVRIADAAGRAVAARTTVPGRPTRDGCCTMRAARVARGSPLVEVTVWAADGAPRWTRRVAFPRPILRLLLLDSDRRGRLFVGARVADLDAAPPYAPTNVATVVQRLELADGADAGALTLAVPEVPDEMLRELAVTDDGAVLQLLPGPSGVEVLRWR